MLCSILCQSSAVSYTENFQLSILHIRYVSMKRIGILTAILLLLLTNVSGAGHFISIGTGNVMGVYYPTGAAISHMLNRQSRSYGYRSIAESTEGSVFNINKVLQGGYEFGLAQSDRQYQAYHGLAEWEATGPRQELRSVFSIHAEAVTLIAAAGSGIENLADLAGKRINIGLPGSGHQQNAKDVIKAFGLSLKDIKAGQIKSSEVPALLQDGSIDAFFHTVGHPNDYIRQATSANTKVNIIPITGPAIDELLERYHYYARAVIPARLYPQTANSQEEIKTIGVKATLITSSRVDENIVYAITREVFENLDYFKKLHPAYALLTRKKMLQGLTAPVHRGALRYYREADLEQYIDPKLIR